MDTKRPKPPEVVAEIERMVARQEEVVATALKVRTPEAVAAAQSEVAALARKIYEYEKEYDDGPPPGPSRDTSNEQE